MVRAAGLQVLGFTGGQALVGVRLPRRWPTSKKEQLLLRATCGLAFQTSIRFYRAFETTVVTEASGSQG